MKQKRNSFLNEAVNTILVEKKATFLANRDGAQIINAYIEDDGVKIKNDVLDKALKDVKNQYDLERFRPEQISEIARIIVVMLATSDPTANINPNTGEVKGAKFLEWIVKQYNNKEFKMEDLARVKEDLAVFADAKLRKRLVGDDADINRYNIDKLYSVIDNLQGKSADSTLSHGADLMNKFMSDPEKAELLKNGLVKLVHKGPNTLVFTYTSGKAGVVMGKQTSWCTKNSSTAEHYSKQSPLFVIYTPDKDPNDYLQWHFASKQFMDRKDRPMAVGNMVGKYPELYDAFTAEAKKYGYVGLMKNPSTKELEDAVKKDPNQIAFIARPTEEMVVTVLKNHPNLVSKISGLAFTPELQRKLLKEAPSQIHRLIVNIPNALPEFQERSIQLDPMSIQYIKNPSRELQMKAIEGNAQALQHIDNVDEQLQWDAVERNPESLRYIKKPNEKLVLHAIKQSPDSLMFVADDGQTWPMVKATIDSDPDNLIWVNNFELYSKAEEYLKSKDIKVST